MDELFKNAHNPHADGIFGHPIMVCPHVSGHIASDRTSSMSRFYFMKHLEGTCDPLKEVRIDPYIALACLEIQQGQAKFYYCIGNHTALQSGREGSTYI